MENQNQIPNPSGNYFSQTQPDQNPDPLSEKPKRKIFKKIITWLSISLVVIIVLYFTLPYILGLFFKDLPSIDDSDLKVSPVAVSNSDNAYYDYQRLEGKIVTEIDGKKVSDFLAGGDWDQNFADSILAKNQDAIMIFNESSTKNYFQDPNFIDIGKLKMEDAPTSYLKDIRAISQVISIQSADLSKKGSVEEAISKALEVADAGQKIENSTCDTVCFLSGITIKDVGLQRLNRLLPNADLSSEKIAIYKNKLSSYLNNKEPLADAFKIEYARQKNTISSSMDSALREANLNPANFKGNFYYQPNRIKELLANDARKYISDLDMSCQEAKSAAEDKTERPKISIWKLYFTPNAVGVILNYVLYTPFMGSNFHVRFCDQEELISSLQNILASK